MGMNFSPMYQPVSTKTIKADGDLNVNPYDLLATDVKCDTVEADEFVGGVGNFESVISDTIKTDLSSTGTLLLFSVPAINYSVYDRTAGWKNATSLTIPQKPSIVSKDELSITCTYTGDVPTINYLLGGFRYYEDGVLQYTFMCSAPRSDNTTTITIPLKYGSTYDFEVYSNEAGGSYAVVQSITTSEIKWYLS